MVHKNFKYMAFGSSLRDLGVSAVHLKPPHGGFGDEWDSNAPGVERGLAIMCTKTSIYFCFTLNFLACSQKPSFSPIFDYNFFYPTNNIYNAYQFSKRQSQFPQTTIFSPA